MMRVNDKMGVMISLTLRMTNRSVATVLGVTLGRKFIASSWKNPS